MTKNLMPNRKKMVRFIGVGICVVAILTGLVFIINRTLNKSQIIFKTPTPTSSWNCNFRDGSGNLWWHNGIESISDDGVCSYVVILSKDKNYNPIIATCAQGEVRLKWPSNADSFEKYGVYLDRGGRLQKLGIIEKRKSQKEYIDSLLYLLANTAKI